MRHTGTLKTWNDERGFGFIEPAQGGPDVFVHIKAFRNLRERPQVRQALSYDVEKGPKGKPQAVRVTLGATPKARGGLAPIAPPLRPQPRSPGGRTSWAGVGLWAIPLFGVVLLLGHVLGRPPHWVLWAYLGASVVTFGVYAWDKSAARQGRWRTSERTLHGLALVGGWPGALLAQQVLRHKSAKAEFRAVFWATVLLNVVGFVVLASPLGRR